MADETAPERKLPNPDEDIRAKGMEFLVGFDVPRQWATGAQVFVTPHTTTIVFREQILAEDEGQPKGLVKNVASIVLPTEVAAEVTNILQREIGKLGGGED